MRSKYGRWYKHPEVEKEKERHEKWGHKCTNITQDVDVFECYLCSCGITLTPNNFLAADLETIYAFQ